MLDFNCVLRDVCLFGTHAGFCSGVSGSYADDSWLLLRLFCLVFTTMAGGLLARARVECDGAQPAHSRLSAAAVLQSRHIRVPPRLPHRGTYILQNYVCNVSLRNCCRKPPTLFRCLSCRTSSNTIGGLRYAIKASITHVN